MNKFKTLLEKIRSNNINGKSKKTIAVIVVIVIILLALLVTGIVLAVKHSRAESLPAAVPGTTAEMAADDADSTMPAEEPTSSAATTAPSGSSSSATKPSGNTPSNSGTSSKPSGGSSGGSSGSNTTSKPSGGGSSGSNTTPKPSTGGTTSKPETTTSKPTTTQPAKKEFAMTKQEIIDYASKYIENTFTGTKYDAGLNKNNAGYNAPSTYTKGSWTEEQIKADLRGSADATYIPGLVGYYRVYVEQIDENTMRVYMFY